ncbi:MAG: hypothetical protein ACRCXV_10035 [Bacteroidales bacterium]
MRKILLFALFFNLLISCVGLSKTKMVELDERISNVSINIYEPIFSNTLIISFDRSFSSDDVMRCLYTSAIIMKDRSFDKIYLANKNDKRYYLDGEYFSFLGNANSDSIDLSEIISQSIEYAYTLEGIPAFPCAKAGWILVNSQRMEYFDDLISELQNDKKEAV